MCHDQPRTLSLQPGWSLSLLPYSFPPVLASLCTIATLPSDVPRTVCTGQLAAKPDQGSQSSRGIVECGLSFSSLLTQRSPALLGAWTLPAMTCGAGRRFH